MKYRYCSNCVFKCVASDCDCICHSQTEAFNYGCEDIIQRIKKIINNLDCKGETLDGLRPKWIDAEELLKKMEELE